MAAPLTVAALLVSFGCAKHNSPVQPSATEIAGVISLSGNLRDSTGASTGTRVLSAPSGIRVYLEQSGTIVDSTLTVTSKYSFTVPAGVYQLHVRAGPTVTHTSSPLTAEPGSPLITLPPLQLTSTGSLVTSPNPFTNSMVTQFSLSATGPVSLSVFSLANLRVRSLVAGASFGSGAHQVAWDGTDDANHPVADGSYWMVFSGGGQDWAELVFKGP